MIKLGKERVEFLKSRGYDKAELYGENECGGLHILQVCKFGAEAQGLVKGAQPSPLATLSKLAQPGAGLGCRRYRCRPGRVLRCRFGLPSS